ncbi:MAG TPA: hypothetical protein PKV88_02840, partial [Bacteroidales bacterium]|nr:hypothetical protein [Bacteroidales bacterium]
MTVKSIIYLVILLFAFQWNVRAERISSGDEKNDLTVILSNPRPDQQLGYETISDFESLTIPI